MEASGELVLRRYPLGERAAFITRLLPRQIGRIVINGNVALGIIMAVRGFGAEFTRHLRMGWMSRSTQDAVVRLGQAGYVARGVVLVGIGIAAVDAAITYDAAEVKGLDGVLRSFAQSPFGPWLLILVALGLIAFGILSFFEAKWRRTLGGVPV